MVPFSGRGGKCSVTGFLSFHCPVQEYRVCFGQEYLVSSTLVNRRCLHYPSWYIAAAPDWPQSKILGVGDRDSPNLSVRQEFVARLESLQESIIIDYILFLYSSGRLMFPHSFSSVMFLGQCLL